MLILLFCFSIRKNLWGSIYVSYYFILIFILYTEKTNCYKLQISIFLFSIFTVLFYAKNLIRINIVCIMIVCVSYI